MVMVIAYDEAKKTQIRIDKGGVIVNTPFFGSKEYPQLPQASLNENAPGRFSDIHYHVSDQFQVVVDGKGTLGRHELLPHGIHFSRAYTPYGPLISDTVNPLTFFVMRSHYDPGAQRLSQKREQLKQVPNRQPWQISRTATFPTASGKTEGPRNLLQTIPGIEDENGLAAYTLSMKPNAKAVAPDPAHSDGQYLVVLRGSLLHDSKEHKAPALVFIRPEEGPFQVRAGSAGLEALVLNFPQVRPRTIPTTAPAITTKLKKWQCTLCAFAYDEALGMPEEGIAAGTRWADVPETWCCPDCSASKSDFQMIEV